MHFEKSEFLARLDIETPENRDNPRKLEHTKN